MPPCKRLPPVPQVRAAGVPIAGALQLQLLVKRVPPCTRRCTTLEKERISELGHQRWHGILPYTATIRAAEVRL